MIKELYKPGAFVILLPFQVLRVMNNLYAAGHAAYVVGGAVRDSMLCRKPHDWDIATDCPAEKTLELFPGSKLVGASFGVVLVEIGGMQIQVARFRTEKGYSDFRHPDEVAFVETIEEDLARRDFTINAMAYGSRNFAPPSLIGPESALKDIDKYIVRAVGDPNERFTEDPLRMMRAIRFATCLEMGINIETARSIRDNAELIKNISAERIQEELNKILLSIDPGFGLNSLLQLGLLQYIIPELIPCVDCQQNEHHQYNVWEHTLKVIENSPPDLVLRLAALFHDIGKPVSLTVDDNGIRHFYGNETVLPHQATGAQIARERLEALRHDRKTIDEVSFLVAEHMFIIDPQVSDKTIRRLINKYGVERLRKLLSLKKADWVGSGKKRYKEVDNIISNFNKRIDQVVEGNPPTSLNDLALNGHEIMQILGLEKPSKEVGIIKSFLMNLVLENPELNTKDRLIEILDNNRGDSNDSGF